MRPISNSLRGILWILASIPCFQLMNVMLRNMADDLHPIQVMFLRNLFGFLVLLPFLLKNTQVLVTKRLGANILRGVAHFCGMALWVYALTLIPLATANALLFSSPLFVTVGAILFMGEKAGVRRWLALFAGFLGVLIILQPEVDAIPIGIGIVLISAILIAISKLLTKRVVETDSALSAVFYLNVLMCLTALIPALIVWESPMYEHYLWFTVLGVVGGLAHFSLTRAVQNADLTTLQSFEFTALIWAAVLGYFLYAEVPAIRLFAGGAIIIAAASYIAHREAIRA